MRTRAPAQSKSVCVDGVEYIYVVESGEVYAESAADSGASMVSERDLARRVAATPMPTGQFESERVSLRTLSMSVVGSCNLGCTYCYVFDDHTPTPTHDRIDLASARRQVDWFVDQAGPDATRLTITFFGGEPFLNFSVLRDTAEYARRAAAKVGREIGFTVTTNGTLLTSEVIDFLWEYDVQTTISLDGDAGGNDLRRRWVGNGEGGSYARIVPKVTALLDRFRTRPHRVGARATLTHGNSDVEAIVDHLLSLGFWEVATSVATVETPGVRFTDEDYDALDAGLARLARRFAESALDGRRFGFSNVANLVRRFHEGSVRDYPCGATIGLAGSDAAGDLYVCHRFIGDDRFRIGGVDGGIDHASRNEFVRGNSVRMKPYCDPCWLRRLCGGGCYHEAMVSGASDFSKLESLCHHLREFYAACLEAYVRIAVGNPDFLDGVKPRMRREIDAPGRD